MQVGNCSRCGKELTVEKMSQLEAIKCNHCNQIHVVHKKSKTIALFVVSLFVFLASLLISVISQVFELPFFVLLIPALIFGFFAYRLSLWTLAKFNKLRYMASDTGDVK